MIFDDRACELGEGPLWHPLRRQLYWFDILRNRLMSRTGAETQEWAFAEQVSATGWISRDELLIASETALFRFHLDTGVRTELVALEADRPHTRSNDGRADPQGGFWIGTMGKKAEPGAGAIWRFCKGDLRRLYGGISIPNSIAFAPGGGIAQFADTVTGKVMRVATDADGWPKGSPEVFLDLTAEGRNPDGSVIDADAVTWLAEWGSARVAAYAPDGTFLRAVSFDAPHTSCPAFGGPDLTTLFCTTAREHMDGAALAAFPKSGMTFATANVAKGQAEHQVIL
ncbi:MAG: SMP-30/gluconolactonase/LRE family protein [Pseudomonadota bacterium]